MDSLTILMMNKLNVELKILANKINTATLPQSTRIYQPFLTTTNAVQL